MIEYPCEGGRIMKKISYLVVSMLTIILLTACNSSAWKEYKGDGVSFSYPRTWEAVDTQKLEMMQKPVVAFVDSNRKGGNSSNVNLIIQLSPFLAPKAKDQAEITNNFFQTAGKSTGIEGYQQIDYVEKKIGDIGAGILTAEYTVAQNNTKTRFMQLYVPVGQKTYILTVSGKSNDWKDSEQTFKSIIDSFKLSK
jgi:hypothetical protein